jgi:hypothetical protein
MARGMEDFDVQGAKFKDIAVPYRHTLKSHLIVRVDKVWYAELTGECQSSAHIVIVNMRVAHCSDNQSMLGADLDDSIDITLRVHDKRNGPFSNNIRPIAKLRCGHDNNIHANLFLFDTTV